jgi:hypothetical protein
MYKREHWESINQRRRELFHSKKCFTLPQARLVDALLRGAVIQHCVGSILYREDGSKIGKVASMLALQNMQVVAFKDGVWCLLLSEHDLVKFAGFPPVEKPRRVYERTLRPTRARLLANLYAGTRVWCRDGELLDADNKRLASRSSVRILLDCELIVINPETQEVQPALTEVDLQERFMGYPAA